MAAFERCLRDVGVPVDEWTSPGLTDAEIDEVVEPLGLRLPFEARVWWQWRNGPTMIGRNRLLGEWHPYLSVSGAVEQYRQSSWVAEQGAHSHPHGDPSRLWNPSWFPILGGPDLIVVDCSVPEDQVTPIRVVVWEEPELSKDPLVGSFGGLLALWMRAIDNGSWEWDSVEQRWHRRQEMIDEDAPRRILI